MNFLTLRNGVIVFGLLFAVAAHADNRVSINGYGYQDYRQTNTNDNVYTYADKRGSWDNNFVGIVSSVRISDRDMLWAQLQTSAAEQTRFTWAFINHRFTDDFSMHVGRVKFPYGLYNEYIDNKALQLSAVKPIAYSSDADMGYDAYSGFGLDWTTGSLFSQLYVGNIYTPPDPVITEPYATDDNINDRRLAGVRFTWSPYDGLRFMISANDEYIQDGNIGTDSATANEVREMFSIDYVSERLDIKSEYNYHKIPDLGSITGSKSNAWYVQGGYKAGNWTPYVRYESYQADKSNTNDPSLYQKEKVAGINYKFDSNINVRIEDHVIQGYALPVAAGAIQASDGKKDWNLMVAQVNFMF